MTSREIMKECLSLWRRTDDVYAAVIRRWKLSPTAFFTMAHLMENPDGMEPAKLAAAVSVQRQLMTLILRDFGARKLILRRECAADHRRKLIFLSKKGRAVAEEVRAAVDALDLRGLAVFSKEEQERLLEFSRRFYEALRGVEK